MLLLPTGFFRVAAAPLLLDTLTSTVKGAWSVRKLRAAYAGACLRVRRSSDNAEQDIGFAGSVAALDTTALLAFCGAGSGYVTKAYDQSTSGQDMLQTVAAEQPFIVNSGSLTTLENATARPGIFYNLQASLLQPSFNLGAVQAAASLSVASMSASAGGYARLVAYTGSGQAFDYADISSAAFVLRGNSAETVGAYRNGGAVSVSSGFAAPFQYASVFESYGHRCALNGMTMNFIPGNATFNFTFPAGVGTSGTDTLILRATEDYYQGDGQFNATLDSTALAVNQVVTAARGTTPQTFTYTGSFGAGAHTLYTTMTNDLYGGPGLDRNIFIGGVTLNGVRAVTATVAGPFASTGALWLGSRPGTVPGDNDHWLGTLCENIMVSGTLSSADEDAIALSQKTYFGTP